MGTVIGESESLRKLAPSQLAGKQQEMPYSLPLAWLGINITARPFTYAVCVYIPSLRACRAGARNLAKGEQSPANRV